MELPFEKTVCRYWKQTMYTLLSGEETQEVRLPESMPDVGRVISSWGQIIIRGKDWNGGSIGINGGVMVWLLYAPEGGGEVQHLESWIPFRIRADIPESREDGVIRVEPFVQGVDARALSSRKILFRAGIGLLTQVLSPDELELYQMGEIPPDVEQKTEQYHFVLSREAGEKSFLMDEVLTLPSGMPKPEKTIYYRMTPEILEQKVLGSKAAFRGMCNLHVLYQDAEGKLTGTDFQVPFAQYVDLEGEYESDAQISGVLCVSSLELDPEADGSLHLKCGLVSQHLINVPEIVELLEDCYSPCRDVELEKQLCSVPMWQNQKCVVDLSATVPGEGSVFADLMFRADAPAIVKRTGTSDIEAGGAFCGLMVDAQGQYRAVQGKDSQTVQLDDQGDTVCFSSKRGSTSARQEGDSWRTDTKLVLELDMITPKPLEMVTGIRLGELREPDPERPSVIIRRRGGHETLWELAKVCGSTVGAIRRMNKLEGEPADDALLLIPVV